MFKTMRKTINSFRHALRGIGHAIATERNLRLFVVIFTLVLLFGIERGLHSLEWMILLTAGGTFMVIELLNTALERLVDVVDEEMRKSETGFHVKLKATKDTASAAALVSFAVVVCVIIIIFMPYLIVW